MFSKDDDDNGGVLGLIFGVVTLVVAAVIGFGIYQANFKEKSATKTVAGQAVNTAGLANSAVAGAVAAVAAGAAGANANMGANGAVAEAASAADAASVKVENGVVKFYFASGKADIATGANEALVDVVKAVAAGKKAVISGFTDATGDAVKNEELSKQRAFAIRDALKALGVAEGKIELKKPENITATGSNAEARRVEVTIQ